MADDDRIIRFPGADGRAPTPPRGVRQQPPARKGKADIAGDAADAPIDPSQLSEDQRKALQIVLSGMSFVIVGIKPTQSGADFFTGIHGDDAELRNAAPHLAGVIERAYTRKGL